VHGSVEVTPPAALHTYRAAQAQKALSIISQIEPTAAAPYIIREK
jgi:hypothetical protein